jgi:hypothetical protein
MTRKDEARPHLEKAQEYLDAARLALEHGYNNAACSLSVTAGINSKDVVCILSVGYSDRGDSHDKAVEDLSKSGPTGAQSAPTLKRLLAKKTKSQYSAPSVTQSDAEQCVKQAGRIFDDAKELFNSTPR